MFITKLTVQGDSGHAYDITAHDTGVLYCTCPAWKFSKQPVEDRACKHVKFAQATLAG